MNCESSLLAVAIGFNQNQNADLTFGGDEMMMLLQLLQRIFMSQMSSVLSVSEMSVGKIDGLDCRPPRGL